MCMSLDFKKKKEELNTFQNFLVQYNSKLSIDELCLSDPLDIIIKLKSGKHIGIELTDLYQTKKQ